VIRIVILAAAIVPSLLILAYWIRKAGVDWRSEAIWSAFFLGAVGTFGALGVELAINQLGFLGESFPVAGSAAKAVFVAAIPEESIKFFILVVLAEKHVDVRRFQDVIVLGLAVSLGFATLENFFYVTSIGDWKTTAGLRALTAVPGHSLDGLAMGALLVSARLDGIEGYRIKDVWSARSALIVPVLLHAAYDFPLLAIEKHVAKIWFSTAWILVIVFSWIFVIWLFNRVLARAAFADLTSPRDAASKEETKRLMNSGAIGLIGGRVLQPGSAALGGSMPALPHQP
jgi:RsiW-degrading membrane proteinase PrsW (M82 family)